MEVQQIKELVRHYQDAIHTQNREDFYDLWCDDNENVLISITNRYVGTDRIYEDFLLGRIQAAYSRIDLLADQIEVRFLDQETAIVLFSYHTKCIKRETGEEYGIAGLETQVVRKGKNGWKLVHVHYSK